MGSTNDWPNSVCTLIISCLFCRSIPLADLQCSFGLGERLVIAMLVLHALLTLDKETGRPL
jgi:hypothetical protein